MMIESWEIRWFGEGSIPLKLQHWSEELGMIAQPVRADHYFIHNGGKALGIKWREGSLQIKERIGKNEKRFENYQKWSFELADGNVKKDLEKHKKWSTISKKREMAKWAVKGKNFSRIEIGEEVESGVEIELSAVVINNNLWWTMAYEATGGQQVLEAALEQFQPPHINNSLCMGYSEWILRILNNGL